MVLIEQAVLVFRQVVGFDNRVSSPTHKGSKSSKHIFKLSHLIQHKYDIPRTIIQYKGWNYLSTTSSFTFKCTFRKLLILSWVVASFNLSANWILFMMSWIDICLSYVLVSLFLRKYSLVYSFIVSSVLNLLTGSPNSDNLDYTWDWCLWDWVKALEI